MTIKRPKGLFLSILNKFSTPYLIDAKYTASLKKLTACHFLEGANPLPEAWHKVLSTNLRQKTQYESF